MSAHHDTHSAWLALGVFLPSLFFLCLFGFFFFFFFFFFFGVGLGLEAVNPGQVLSPLAAFLVSFLSFLCLVISVVFGLGWTWINFVMKWIKRGNLCWFILPNPNPNKNAPQTQLFPQVACSQITARTGSIWGSRI